MRANSSRGVCSVNVNIRGGTYRLGAPLSFTADDSGAEDAEVVYRAAPGETVVISGAESVTGWTLHDAGLGIWKAEVATETLPRQLYVNGTRAVRARTPDYPNYYYPTDTGYYYEYIIGLDPQIPPTWQNPTAVEAVTVTQWKMMRCPVAEVVADRDVIMQDYCWKNVNVFPEPWNFQLLSWWENAYEFLDEAGEWYLEPATRTLYYIPREGEDMTTAEVELPVLETLLSGAGDVSRPISYIGFENLSFMHATWTGPGDSDGYALDQSGFILVGSDHAPNAIGHDPATVSVPGNLSFAYAHDIVFNNNSFAHMGGIA
ncbi:MAG TPA: hypothetical protein PLZ86_09900, partial [bacterium]|nr:hypothetical protein [bacterium]